MLRHVSCFLSTLNRSDSACAFKVSIRNLRGFLATTPRRADVYWWPNIAAVYIIGIMPGLIIFALTQRWYMRGLQEGALKA